LDFLLASFFPEVFFPHLFSSSVLVLSYEQNFLFRATACHWLPPSNLTCLPFPVFVTSCPTQTRCCL
jgi:hypothetical protein